VRVGDDGIGMAPETLRQAFDLFVQAERTYDRRRGGLGIGLTVVRRLVEQHGGSVEAYSAGLGQGSEIEVRLPVLPPVMVERQDFLGSGTVAGPAPALLNPAADGG
jgi:signal transduction histidine kinase